MTQPAPSVEAPPSEQMLAKERIEQLVWDELLRVVKAIRVDRTLGATLNLSIKIDGFSANGPALVIAEEDVAALAVAELADLIGQDLDLCLEGGRLLVYSPSWRHDEIPF